ncbi:hypothetical protein M8I34_32185 [Streptomyces sp. MCA2]|uniref:hypothetical protein n=1 Tax=Streptomyces sp. MCA2 TaxID=2944805 RepID=UPI0020212D33|nr:hypothetical protein [Streptomyces sp. MCA2]MCL7496028.1 hypothetical protein [Streptomyces sp. MCA2]
MAGPDRAHTQEEFTQALRQLVSETGRSTEDIAKQGGLSGNTVRGVTAGKNWPQQRTLEQLVRACGQEPRLWVEAWAPLNDARPQPGRLNKNDLQEQIDALESEVTTLRGQVRSLRASLEQGECGDQRRAQRKADAYYVFLTQMPNPEFRRAKCEEGGRASPVRSYVEPAYAATEVESFLKEVNKLATIEDLPNLALKLATSPLPDEITSFSPYLSESRPSDYAKSDVDEYFSKLQACVHQYLRDCTDKRPHVPSNRTWVNRGGVGLGQHI